MKTVNYISHMLQENVEDIKALALFFDQINIIEQRHLHIAVPPDAKPGKDGKVTAEVFSTNDFTEEEFLLHLKDFEQSKLIRYQIDIDSVSQGPVPGSYSASSDIQISDLVLSHVELIGEKLNERRTIGDNGQIRLSYEVELNNEATAVTEKLFRKDSDTKSLLLYYARVVRTFVNYYEQGKDVLTTSKYVDDLFQVIRATDRFKQTQIAFKSEFDIVPSFALEAMKLGLPNLGKFPPEEILRFKESSKSELLEFQDTLQAITFDLLSNYDSDYISRNAQKIANIKIRPLVQNIADKLDSSKFKLVQELIKEAKDPKTYSPLILTLGSGISSSMILLISVGLVGLNAGLEHYSRFKEAKKDGVYYLYKARQYFA